jgi:hypothetical protein
MRTIAAVALALTMLFTVANAYATTHKKHHHHAAAKGDQKDATKEAPKAAKEKAPATK